ncbi:MAG: phenylacetic acid degradation operon negative regulatory protein PaaX [Alphaproteobacteria bacterium]|nr:MAG: phenylacetic acid degradation operon negative regulatory protein PaaX [Alphaproteobacteria bacterium]
MTPRDASPAARGASRERQKGRAAASTAGGPAGAPAISRLLDQLRPRAKALIATIFGDALLPIGGGIWLKDLIRLTRPFGMSERLARTAVFRLKADDWLSAERIGRESFYRLTERGLHSFLFAAQRIYALPETQWDGRWSVAILSPDLASAERDRLVKAAGWTGFAAVGRHLLIHPSARQSTALRSIVSDIGLAEQVLLLEGQDLSALPPARVGEIVARFWSLDSLAALYREFVARFHPYLQALSRRAGQIGGEEAFTLRTLLIHEYRRILLKDPGLPLALLPEEWPGREAVLLTRDLYRILAAPAQNYVLDSIKLDRLKARPDTSFYARFGGL